MQMQRTRASPQAVQDLVELARVHRDVYVDRDLFALEQARVFERAWIFVGHDSELPEPGDYLLARLGRLEIVVVRQHDGAIKAWENRCPHRGARLVAEPRGRMRRFSCAYHCWVLGPDGTTESVPAQARGYPDGFCGKPHAPGAQAVRRVASYRGFIFASHAAQGPELTDFLGPMTSALDNMTDRAPAGRLVQAGGRLQMAYRGNWKLFMENVVDLVHPMYVHGGAVAVARSGAAAAGDEGVAGQTTQMLLANALQLDQWDQVPLTALPQGHVHMGAFYRDGVIAPQRADPVHERYVAALEAARGPQEAARILGVRRFNNLIWPTLAVNAQFQTLRQVIPLDVNHTVIVSYGFRMEGAPPEMFELMLRFLNTASSPSSLVASDDLEIFERCQQGMEHGMSDWLDISRGLGAESDVGGGVVTASGTSELPIRHQLMAWRQWMMQPAP